MFHTRCVSLWGRVILISCLLVVVMGMLSGCADNTTAVNLVKPTATSVSSIPVVPITAVDYGYIMSSKLNVQAGLVDIAMVNNGSEAHQAQVARLNEGVTADEVVNTLVTKKDQAAGFSLLTFEGGPDTLAPGYGQEAILDLKAGQYVLLCFVVGQDGIPHVDKGMFHFFTVSAQQSQKDAPVVDGKVIMKDYSYELPGVIGQAGALMLEVENQGTVPHEMNIVKLEKGKGIGDIAAFFQSPSGPPPFEERAGFAAIAPGGSGWIKIHLEPGNYAVFSFIPDEKTGRSQLSMGMIKAFSVQ
jgi:hypothetical protein